MQWWRHGAWRHLLLLWLAANSLRMTLLAVPPLLPAIHRDLHLSETLVGILSGLPVLLLAVASVFGSLVIAYLGARRALVLGLVLVAVAGACRGVGSSAAILFAMTFAMGLGVAVAQPAMPALVRQWFPNRIGQATALMSNGFLIGEIVAAALTVPLILPLVGGSWQAAFGAWSVPVALTAIALLLAPAHGASVADEVSRRWWPDWRNGQTWRLGLAFGCASAAYFSSNAFLPDYLRATHHAAYTGAALNSLNLSQLPASLVAAVIPRRVIARRWPFIVIGVLMLVAGIGFGMGGVWVVVWAAVMGFSTAAAFVLTLALPPLLAAVGDVHRLSAAIFTLSYACPLIASLLGGVLWDATGAPLSAFLPLAASGVILVLLVLRLDVSKARQRLLAPG